MKEKTWKFLAILNFILVVVCLTLILPSCSNSGNPGTVQPPTDPRTLKIPAANVLFRPMNVAQAADSDVNTDIKIYADQVQLDNKNTSLKSTDVQSAFQEVAPDLAAILPGTWKVEFFDDHQPGTITFNNDGTFTCDKNGGEIVAPNFGYNGGPTPCTVYPDTYEVKRNEAIVFDLLYDYDGCPDEHVKVTFLVLNMTDKSITKAQGGYRSGLLLKN